MLSSYVIFTKKVRSDIEKILRATPSAASPHSRDDGCGGVVVLWWLAWFAGLRHHTDLGLTIVLWTWSNKLSITSWSHSQLRTEGLLSGLGESSASSQPGGTPSGGRLEFVTNVRFDLT